VLIGESRVVPRALRAGLPPAVLGRQSCMAEGGRLAGHEGKAPAPAGQFAGHGYRDLVGCPGEHAASRSAVSEAGPVIPHELPPALSLFAGRLAETATLSELAGRSPGAGSTRVLVVDGPAGIGKTALVVHWAHTVATDFVDGPMGSPVGSRPCRGIGPDYGQSHIRGWREPGSVAAATEIQPMAQWVRRPRSDGGESVQVPEAAVVLGLRVKPPVRRAADVPQVIAAG
jgi:hypothetical protein